jgi:hypothetical protein
MCLTKVQIWIKSNNIFTKYNFSICKHQSDVIIRSDDWFLNVVVDSDSIVSKILLNFVLWLFCFVFFVFILTKILQFYPSWFFCPHTDKHLAVLSKSTFDTQSILIFGLFANLCFLQFHPEISVFLVVFSY